MATLPKDPVCGMEVNPSEAAGSAAQGGATYYFCSVGCKHAFEREPGKYLAAGYKPSMLGAMLGRVKGLFAGRSA